MQAAQQPSRYERPRSAQGRGSWRHYCGSALVHGKKYSNGRLTDATPHGAAVAGGAGAVRRWGGAGHGV